MRGDLVARARWLLVSACALTTRALAADDAAAIPAVPIPFRAAEESLGRQTALTVGVTLLVLALAAAMLLALRRRLGAGSAPAVASDALRCIASLRLPPQTRVHVIAYRDREWLLVQAGERLQCLPGGAPSGSGETPCASP